VVPGEVLVHLSCDGASDTRFAAVCAGVGVGEVTPASRRLGLCRLRLRPGLSVAEAMKWLAAHPGVGYVEPNVRYTVEEEEPPTFVPNDPQFSFQYGIPLIQADRAWEIYKPKGEVILAIIDSGVDASHPDLTDAMARDPSGILGFDSLKRQRGDASDDYYHGTHCAGVAAARANNALGIAGVAGVATEVGTGVKIMPVKVLDAKGRGSSYSISEGIVWAADNGARVLSLSLGAPLYAVSLARAVSYAQAKGCLVIAAAGNQGVATPSYPAGLPGVIAVGATDSVDELASFSNFGPWVTVTAPGVQILSTTPTGTGPSRVQHFYDTRSGTSMACPFVAAEAALLMAQNPSLTAPEVARLILDHVDPITTTGSGPSAASRALAPGAGRINVRRSLEAVSQDLGPTALASLVLAPARVPGGQPVVATINLRGAAPTEDLVVRLVSGDPEVVVAPEQVVIPIGARSVAVPVSTSTVPDSRSVLLTASALQGEVAAMLQLEPEATQVDGLVLDPASLIGGATTHATISVTQPARAGGARIVLKAEPAEALLLPESVIVPEGATRVTVPLATRPVGADTSVGIVATCGGASETASLTLHPPAVQTVVLRPSVARINRQISVTVTLDGTAPAGGVELRVTGDRPELLEIPAPVRVPEGAREVTFRLLAMPVPVTTPVEIAVTSGGIPRAATLTILPTPLGNSGAAAR
jgi:thermitase